MRRIDDLNEILFETLERLVDGNLDEDEMKKEIERSKAITDVAETIIKSGELSIKAMVMQIKTEEDYCREIKMPGLVRSGD